MMEIKGLLRPFLLLVTCFFGCSLALSNASLPSYPLAVKSPYLSTWMPGFSAKDLATAQPQFWQGQNLTWPIIARVGKLSYALFGLPIAIDGILPASTIDIAFSSSHTYFTVQAGVVRFVLDFFSPIFPAAGDYAKHSLPYSYLTIQVEGGDETVQILTAIDQTWTAQNGAAGLNFTKVGSIGFFQFWNPNEILFTEDNEMATWGSVIFGATVATNLTYACNNAANVYNAFVGQGSLPATNECTGTDLAAFAWDFGIVAAGSTANTTFAVGHDRPQAINYLNVAQTGCYRTQWPTIPQALEYFLSNYGSALSASTAFDAKIRTEAESVSSDFGSQYADILEASVRQAYGALELTVPESDAGSSEAGGNRRYPAQTPLSTPASSPWLFLKEISSDGNLNTVDVMFQSWPIFFLLSPEYIKLFWDPILPYLQAGRWPAPYVIHDMGTHYPNATGHDDGVAELMPLYETSSLFILLLAYQQATNDTSYAQGYSALLDSYAQYLVNNTLHPASQLTSVDAIPAAPNQIALAIQSTIGLRAASVLSHNATYANLSASFASALYDRGLGLDGPDPAASTHFTYYYGQPTTWNVLFAAYSDVLLGLQTFPAEAWELQSTWYAGRFRPGGLPFAGPRDDPQAGQLNITWGLTDWNFMAASVSSMDVQKQTVTTTWDFLTNRLNNIPFGTKHEVEGPNLGQWAGNKARSTVGTHFALLTMLGRG